MHAHPAPGLRGRVPGDHGRYLRDRLMTIVVTGGGVLVILAIVLVFVHLLYVTLPLFSRASHTLIAEYTLDAGPSPGTPFLLDLEEGAEVAGRYALGGDSVFFRTRDGSVLDRFALPVEVPAPVSLGRSSDQRFLLYGTHSGGVLIAERLWQARYTGEGKVVQPVIRYPFGAAPLAVDALQRPVRQLSFEKDDAGATLVVVVEDPQHGHTLVTNHYRFASSLLDEGSLVLEHSTGLVLPLRADFLLLDPRRRYVWLASSEGEVRQYRFTGQDAPEEVAQYHFLGGEEQLESMAFLVGGRSILAGGSAGGIEQWAQYGRSGGSASGAGAVSRLHKLRDFRIQGAVRGLYHEHRRKGFFAISDASWLGLYHTTAERRLIHEPIAPGEDVYAAAAGPRSNALLLAGDGGQMRFYHLHNPHPEISWSSLWRKVWYEGYDKAEYIWQSSSASEDFEPKFSLMPISFGTLKATFYAVLFAIPIALLGAIYTACFMSPPMRQLVKPTIEIMEALPTVILGFLAGLWLAPFAEDNLLGIALLLPALPAAVLLTAAGARHLPATLRQPLERGWQALVLIPVLLVAVWASMALGQFLDAVLFERGFIAWLNSEWDMDFRQRNSVVIGIAMGFAVIPTIFSIAEDALFGVPNHLSRGSLALGATPWQTLVRVVLLTASPGIFSAVLIGLGRVVGETMIVLMATGNTPVMDMNILHGMRTLSANIAIELPEAEVQSTHFRVLYLAALLLFAMTFLFNTAGEVVRQRLRRRYGSL